MEIKIKNNDNLTDIIFPLLDEGCTLTIQKDELYLLDITQETTSKKLLNEGHCRPVTEEFWRMP